MNKASIWKDKIILNWDGVLPPNTPKGAIHSDEDVVHFWEHLSGFIKWSVRMNAYVMNLSLQNIDRLNRQFPNLQWRSQDEVHRLRAQKSFFYKMIEMANKVKNLPFDRLPKYDYKVPPLGEYQHRGVVFLRNVKRAPLFADCGLGKTYMVLTSTELQIKKREIPSGKTLICGKLATLREGWERDTKKFTDLTAKTLWLPTSTKNRKEKIAEMINSPADIYIINHDGIRIFEEELIQKRFSKVVVDESTILKNFHGLHKAIKGGQFGRSLMAVSASADYRVIMSGTPAPNGPDDLWGQFYFLDPDGVIMEPSFNDFRQEYMQLVDLRPKSRRMKTDSSGQEYYVPPGPKDPKEWMPKKDMIERVGSLSNPISYRLRIRDHLKDLPECTKTKRMVEMTKEQKIHYKDMLDKLKVVIDDVRITVPVKLTQIMKLRQITGGFIIDNEEVAHVIPDNPKLEELDSLLEEIGKENKVVIYAQYQWEIKLIESRYKDRGAVTVYGGNSSERNLKNISTFINDEACKMIVLHPKSAAHGITFTMAHYMIFYSIDHSAEDNYQCVKRIDRAGQKLPTFVYYLLCEGSIDKTIYQVVIDKLKDQEELLSQQSLDQLIIDLWRENEAS